MRLNKYLFCFFLLNFHFLFSQVVNIENKRNYDDTVGFNGSIDANCSAIKTKDLIVNLFFRPQWKVIRLGSNKYIKKIIELTDIKFFLNCTVKSIKITKDQIKIKNKNKLINYDYLIFANHADEIRKILPNNFAKQKKILYSMQQKVF